MIDTCRYNKLEYFIKHNYPDTSKYRFEILDCIRRIRENPEFYYFHEGLGLHLSEIGLYDDALEEYNIVLDLIPDYDEIYTSIGINFIRASQIEEAKKAFNKAISYNEFDDEALFYLGKISADQGDLSDGLDKIVKAIRIDPEYANYHHELGRIYLKTGRYREAVDEFNKAIKLDKSCSGYYNSLSQALIELKYYAEAEKILKKAILLDDCDDLAYNNLADLLNIMGRTDEAFIEVKKALKINSKNFYGHATIGACYLKMGKTDKAEEHFRRAIKINPNYSGGHENLGIVLYIRESYGEAIKEFETAIRLDPYNVNLRASRLVIANYRDILESVVEKDYESYLKSMIRDYLDNYIKSGNCEEILNKDSDDIATIFIPDTNAFIDCPDFNVYREHVNAKSSIVFLTPIVLKELDRIKSSSRDDFAQLRARQAIRMIDDLKTKGNLIDGVKIDDHITVRWSQFEPDHLNMPGWLDLKLNDDYILGTILEVKKTYRESRVILVTYDKNLGNKADILKIESIKPPKSDV